MLKTEKPSNAARAIAAFRMQQRTRRRGLDCIFEHGQLWIVDNSSGAAWSVVDASGGNSVDGFDFEQVSQGEEY